MDDETYALCPDYNRRVEPDAPGVVFAVEQKEVDFEHGQTGVAPNAIELHPILGFRCGS